MPERKRKVVYLIGTGASHAELKYRDPANTGLLMSNVVQGVFNSLANSNERDPSIRELLNILDIGEPDPYKGIDIENIITLYESTGTAVDRKRANKLKKLFRTFITDNIDKIKHLDGHPKLLTALIDMYNVKRIDEKLHGIITINYDDFIEGALMNIYDGINYPFEVDKGSNSYKSNNKLAPLCKLHGSFSWENTNPVKVKPDLKVGNEDQLLWVPPGVIKRNDHYPFNAIWGTARRFLKCDILRIIGCSLNKNDWSLITLLHTTKRLRNDISEKYSIEYIGFPTAYKKFNNEFPYFEIRQITELEEFKKYMEKEYKEQYILAEGDSEKEKMNNWLIEKRGSFNIFLEWLKAKAYYYRVEKLMDISTDKHYFETMYFG